MQQHRTRVLRAAIEEERRKLAEARGAFVAVPCADENETASFHENLNVVTIFMQRAQQRLRHLEHSMAALEHQPCTLCEDCGEDIAPERLAARPDATRCTRCQEDWEEDHLRRMAAGHGAPVCTGGAVLSMFSAFM